MKRGQRCQGWRRSERNPSSPDLKFASIRVAELRHAVGIKMDYVPSKAGDKEDVEAYLGALESLGERLRTSAM